MACCGVLIMQCSRLMSDSNAASSRSVKSWILSRRLSSAIARMTRRRPFQGHLVRGSGDQDTSIMHQALSGHSLELRCTEAPQAQASRVAHAACHSPTPTPRRHAGTLSPNRPNEEPIPLRQDQADSELALQTISPPTNLWDCVDTQPSQKLLSFPATNDSRSKANIHGIESFV